MDNNQSLAVKESILARLKKNKLIRKISLYFLLIWFIFSVVYIGRDQILKILNFVFENAYRRGVADSVKAILDGSDNCQTIRVFLNDKERSLIDVNCLRTGNQEIPSINKKK